MALLKGNLHTHTHLSDGLLSPEAVIARYRALGYDFLAITDHDDLIGEDYWQRIPKVATDDAHRDPHFGRAGAEVDAPRDRDAILRAIKAGDFRLGFAP